MSAHFGPGGNSDEFRRAGWKSTLDAPRFVASCGLDAYEYEAGQGISATPETLSAIGREAVAHGVRMSLHTPYFVSLSSVEPEKRQKSVEYLYESARASADLGAIVR